MTKKAVKIGAMSLEAMAKADELAEILDLLKERMASHAHGELALRIKYAAEAIAPTISDSFTKSQRIDKIRYWIKANAYLEECRNYLQLIKRMDYSDTTEILSKVDEITNLLWKDYRLIIQRID